jgi:hypothetical protein
VAGIAGSSPESVKKGAAAFVGCGGPRLRVAVVDDVGDDGAHARHGGASTWGRWPRGRSGTAAMAFGGRIWEEKRRRGERGEEGRVSEASGGERPGGMDGGVLIPSCVGGRRRVGRSPVRAYPATGTTTARRGGDGLGRLGRAPGDR